MQQNVSYSLRNSLVYMLLNLRKMSGLIGKTCVFEFLEEQYSFIYILDINIAAKFLVYRVYCKERLVIVCLI